MSGRSHPHRMRSAGTILLGALMAVIAVSPTAAARPLGPSANQAPTQTLDLASALADDGTFVGGTGVSGTVDASAWSLVSDLTAGEAPRFAPQGNVTTLAASTWSALGSNGPGTGALTSQVSALAVRGSDLFVGGSFSDAAGIPEADYVARWDGSNWFALGSNGVGAGAITSSVFALAVSRGDLYVGGQFVNAKGIAEADRVARWDGSDWFALGSTSPGVGAITSPVYALAVSGSDLFVGGGFNNAQGINEADNVARWDGSNWFALGSTSAGVGPFNNFVRVLAVSGSDLLAGGDFTDAAGIPEADRVARWNGSKWFALGPNEAIGASVMDIAVSGSNVFVGGIFTDAAGIPEADYIARWNGSNWFALGSNGAGVGALAYHVYDLAVSGGDLFVAGDFLDADGIAEADRVARWDGTNWFALSSTSGPALDSSVLALAVSATTLFAGGFFMDADGIPEADRVAAWGPVPIRKPDGRIKKGSGAFVGNNIYNTTGVNQTKTGKAARGSKITFTFSIQNDGTAADSFKVLATGALTAGYQVTYFRGTTNITAAVVAGTYQTTSLAPGATFAIKAKVKVLAGATVGSSVTRLLTTSSVVDPSKIDAVKLIGKRG